MTNKENLDENYLTLQNGCLLIDKSSEHQRGPASSILSTDPKSLWVTSDKLPQECIVSLKKILKKPAFYNTVGVYCWHQYDSNPSLIEVWGKSVPQLDKWQIITKIRLSLSDSWQYFKIQDLNADKLKQLKFKIIQNFGDSKTYINKVGLLYINPVSQSLPQKFVKQKQKNMNKLNNDQNNIQKDQKQAYHLNDVESRRNANAMDRQNMNSEYYKSDKINQLRIPSGSKISQNTSPNTQVTINQNQYVSVIQNLQQQVKKAHNQIRKLNQKQQLMQSTLCKQNKIIANMEHTLGSLVKIIDSMQKVQKIQQSSASHSYIVNTNDKNNGMSKTNIKNTTNKNRDYNESDHIQDRQNKYNQSSQQSGMQDHPYNSHSNKFKYRQRLEQKVSSYKKSKEGTSKQQIQYLKIMLNNLEKQSFGSSKQKQKQKSKSKQTGNKKIENKRQKQNQQASIHRKSWQKQKQKKTKQKQGSDSKYQVDVIKTNTQDDLSEYDHNAYYYRTSLTQYNHANPQNRSSNVNSNDGSSSNKLGLKGEKARMLQRLVKLIKLKEMKKQQLKKSGTKSREKRQKQSIYEYQNQYGYQYPYDQQNCQYSDEES